MEGVLFEGQTNAKLAPQRAKGAQGKRALGKRAQGKRTQGKVGRGGGGSAGWAGRRGRA